MIVGYGPGRKGRPMAIVVTKGRLVAVRLRDIVLQDVPQDLGKVVKFPTSEAS